MLKWTVLMSFLLLVQFTTANPVSGNIYENHEKLNKQIKDVYNEYMFKALKEIRSFFESVSKEFENTTDFEKDINAYKDFLEMTKDFENANMFQRATYLKDANELLPFDEMNLKIITQREKLRDFPNNAQFLNATQNISQASFRSFQKVGYLVRDYLKDLPKREQQAEVLLTEWYYHWWNEHDARQQGQLVGALMDVLESPKHSEEILKDKLRNIFEEFIWRLQNEVKDTQEEKYIKAFNNTAAKEINKFYVDFNKWLLSEGLSHFEHQQHLLDFTQQFFCDIDHYAEFYGSVPKLVEWYEDLQKTETFEATFEQYWKVLTILEIEI